jgi:hypothetical protein
MSKKDIAISFLKLASSGKVREAYEKYVHPDFSHHNPYFKGDRESLLVGRMLSSTQGSFVFKTHEIRPRGADMVK